MKYILLSIFNFYFIQIYFGSHRTKHIHIIASIVSKPNIVMEICFQGPITEVQIEEITFRHLALLLKVKFHSRYKFRNTPHKLVV